MANDDNKRSKSRNRQRRSRSRKSRSKQQTQEQRQPISNPQFHQCQSVAKKQGFSQVGWKIADFCRKTARY
uniref:Uncharacterized protein n=1 Tax=Ditylenchus dipsaci TaxID=166011 RepID=A0A915EPX5_9BILA